MRAWALFDVQLDSSGDDKEIFRIFGAYLCCYKIPLVYASHQPTSKALDSGDLVFRRHLERWRNHWEQMLPMGPSLMS